MANDNNINIIMKTKSKMARQSIHELSNEFTTLGKDSKLANTSMSGLSNTLGRLTGVVKGIGLYALSSQLADVTQSAMDVNESIHLYNIAMGDFAESTGRAIDKLSELSGLDRVKMLDTVGEYSLLARSMGLSAENASILAENTNRLALDLGALTNRSFTKVAEDLRSGLIGQSKTMYKYGIDVTEAAIKQEALNQGIKKSVRHMSQAEKMALRYSVMLKQSGLAHADFANTIERPANQLRILSERFLTLGRSIGNLFIPMLNSVLPYLNAIVVALTKIVNRIAMLFGGKGIGNEQIKNTGSGFGGIADDIGDIGDSADKSGKKADKLKKKLQDLAGFDELNILGRKETPSSGGKGGGADDNLGAIDFELEGYDSMIDSIQQKTDELVDKMEKGLKRILDIAILIGSAILAWKISNAIMDFFSGNFAGKGIIGILKEVGKRMGILTSSGTISQLGYLSLTLFIMITRFIDLIRNSELFRKGLVSLYNIAKKVFSFIIKQIGKLIDGFKLVGEKVYMMFPESWRNTMSRFVKAFDLDFGDLLVTMAGIGLLFTPAAPFGIALLKFEALTLALRHLGYITSDAIDEVDLFGNVSEKSAKKLEPFINNMQDLQVELDTLSWGNMIISDETIDDIKSRVASITDVILEELDSDRNEALANLSPLRDALGEEAYNELVLANEQYYDEMFDKVKSNEKRILEILTEAHESGEGLSQSHYEELNRIQAEMMDIGLQHLSENNDDYLAIKAELHNAEDRLNVEHASKMITKAIETRDELIANANEQYANIEKEANRMLSIGAINEEQYNKIMESAKKTKDDTINNANLQYTEIENITKSKLGDLNNLIDYETGNIKTKWDLALETILTWTNNKLNAILDEFGMTRDDLRKIFDDMLQFLKAVFAVTIEKIFGSIEDIIDAFVINTSSGVKGIKDIFRGLLDFLKGDFSSGWGKIWDGVVTMFGGKVRGMVTLFRTPINIMIDMVNGLFRSLNKIKIPDWVPSMGGKGFNFSPISRIPALARGGQLDAGQLFIAGEAGAEIVGDYQGKTTVMPLENTGFVSSMENAVVRGVTSAMSGINLDGNSDVTIIIGDKTILNSLKDSANRESRISGESVIRV